MKKYTELKEEERVEIFKLRQSGHKIKKIAGKLNRAKSTISRELARNKYSDIIAYLPDIAHFIAKKRRHVQPYQFKKALLTNIDDSSLIEIQNQFNNIPRKVLGYKTPLELFTKYLKRVALQT
jgi:IS30 family transposase